MYSSGKNYFQEPVNINIETRYANASSPEIFGPALWFILHNASVFYPDRPSRFAKVSMKNLILNLHILIPCQSCKEHYYNFIKKVDLDKVVVSRENLFTFFVGLHNYVNFRLGKREMTIEEAKKTYGFSEPGKTTVFINYK
jgi:hypothetical protein